MNIYTQRYRNALKKAAKINFLLKKGYNVFHEGTSTHLGFILRDKSLFLKESDNTSYLYYEHNPEFDHGYYTKIDEWNKTFNESFKVFVPSAKVKI